MYHFRSWGMWRLCVHLFIPKYLFKRVLPEALWICRAQGRWLPCSGKVYIPGCTWILSHDFKSKTELMSESRKPWVFLSHSWVPGSEAGFLERGPKYPWGTNAMKTQSELQEKNDFITALREQRKLTLSGRAWTTDPRSLCDPPPVSIASRSGEKRGCRAGFWCVISVSLQEGEQV